MKEKNQLEEVIKFWINEFGLMEVDVDEITSVLRAKCGHDWLKKDIILSGMDLSVVEDSENEEDKKLFPIFIVKNEIENTRDKLMSFFKNALDAVENDKKEKEKEANEEKRYNYDFRFILISKTPEISVKIENMLQSKGCLNGINEIKGRIKKINSAKRTLKLNMIFTNYPNAISNKEKHSLQINQMNSQKFCSENVDEIQLTGRVCTVRLFDVVALYNKLGENLFIKNVRLGIQDVLDVDSSIRKTLNDNPGDFWFLNNGITLYAPKGCLEYLTYSSVEIIDKFDKISIVNGAQTISSSAKFFYDDTIDDAIKKSAIEKAYVIFKIIELDEKEYESTKVRDRVNNVTISLNRQKPIIKSDIVYTCELINAINECYKNTSDERAFKIVRRGENSSIPNKHYRLDDLTRVLYAVKAEHPGEARSKGINTLLKLKGKEATFANEKVFINLQNKEEDDINEILLEEYRYVNLSMEIHRLVSSEFNKILKSSADLSEKESAILKYAKYHVTYFLKEVYCELQKDGITTKEFIDCLKGLDFINILKSVSDNWHKVKNNEAKEIWDSNEFKKDNVGDEKIYEPIINSLTELFRSKITNTN